MKVRIGIDVGGTFTDGVVINNESSEVIGKVKVPTTHSSEDGVAKGIIDVLMRLVEDYDINLKDVIFLAHGTTQATNALLEGDVDPVGIVATGKGIEGKKAKSDTNIEDIELAPGKFIKTSHAYIESRDLEKDIIETINRLKAEGACALVAAEPYSVDNNSNELYITECGETEAISVTGTHEISSLYGLKLRTRTAVINASILPKMIQTATMTDQSVKKAGIESTLMIMRCDGGVMSIDEIKRRPILTLLSGPAAGVAGALMYEKLSDGIFLEVGGTSTDISVIKNGETMLKYAEIGGHKTYVNSLDVRTLGIAGGSMIKIQDNQIVDVGPRSAHIAGFDYESFTSPESLENCTLETTEDGYAIVVNEIGKRFALTLTGAANILNEIPKEGYSNGNRESTFRAFDTLAKASNQSVEMCAQKIMDIAVGKVVATVENLIKEYDLDTNIIELVGGGGGAGSIVPYLSKHISIPSHLARNAEVISTIGVALAMVREVVDRTIMNPTEDDLLKIRKEAEDAIIRSGARRETISIKIEIDKQNNLVRAIASGSSELKNSSEKLQIVDKDSLLKLAANSMEVAQEDVRIGGDTSGLTAFISESKTKKMFGLLSKKIRHLRVISHEGVIKLKLTNSDLIMSTIKHLERDLVREIEKRTRYSDGGEELPMVYVACGSQIVDLSGLIERAQIINMTLLELAGYNDEEAIAIILENR